VLCSWIATGNNIQLGGDMPRRCYWVRMDAKCAKPFQRSGFRHDDLKAWTREHRGELLAALLTLARAWYSKGRPRASVRPLGSFESWATVMGGILEHAGISGFLANSDELHSQADGEAVQWEGFLLALDEIFDGEPFLVADIIDKLDARTWTGSPIQPTEGAQALRTALPDSLSEWLDRPGSLQRRLGNAFSERVGRRFGESGVYIEKAGAFRHATQWRLVAPRSVSL
jgi:hypothetical protein